MCSPTENTRPTNHKHTGHHSSTPLPQSPYSRAGNGPKSHCQPETPTVLNEHRPRLLRLLRFPGGGRRLHVDPLWPAAQDIGASVVGGECLLDLLSVGCECPGVGRPLGLALACVVDEAEAFQAG
jgi:hypothetical protein